MNKKIDLTQILKDCPKGTKFYTPTWGEVTFIKINIGCVYPICIETNVYDDYINLTKDGRYLSIPNTECIIFPSKDQRDWPKFVAPWYKKDKFDPKTLKPFDRVIVRNNNGEWKCAIFSHIKDYDSDYRYDCCYMIYRYCIPYNEDTKHLLGTTDEAPEFYRYWDNN